MAETKETKAEKTETIEETPKAENKKEKESWIKLKPAEVEKKILELAKEGLTSEKIGLVLRDKHGIPKAKIFGKKITQILKENDLYEDSEYNHIGKKLDNLKKHLEKNRHDYSAKRSLITYSGKYNKMGKLKAQ